MVGAGESAPGGVDDAASQRGPIRVLHVDDDPAFAELAATFLERHCLTVLTETHVDDALAALDGGRVDCIVSDYNMPDRDGLDFLRAVRERDPDLPFVLFTGRGSEEIASEAISAGVTEYMQKGRGADQYEVLANRVRNAVERYRAEQGLVRTEQRFRRMIEQNLVGSYVIQDGTLTYANPKLAEIFGYDPDEVVGMSPFDLVDESDHDRLRENLRRREAGDVDELQYRLAGRRKNGEQFTFEVHGGRVETDTGPPAIVGALVEVTDADVPGAGREDGASDREAELVEERDRFAALFDNIPDPVIAFAFDDGAPIAAAVNDAFEQAFGFDAQTVVGEDVDDYIVPVDREDEAAELNHKLQHGESLHVETRRRTANGVRDILLHVVPLERDAENVQGFAIYTDITEQKQRERELERQNERLDRFASVVSHDLRNPLAVADGSLALLADELADDLGESNERVAAIDGALDRMDALIDDVLTLAREGRTVGATEVTPFETVVEAAWLSVSDGDVGHGTLVAGVAGRSVVCDPGRLQQLFENLFRNAIEHGGPGVTVEVSLTPTGFAVADDGPGIPPAARDRALDAGYTTAENGTGLGLAIVSEIARAHGWTVELGETDDGGVRIEFDGVETAAARDD